MSKKKKQPMQETVVIATKKPRRVCSEVVEIIPAICPRCHSTDHSPLEGIKRIPVRGINGNTRDGRQFNQVKWGYCTCRACDFRFRAMSRENK